MIHSDNVTDRSLLSGRVKRYNTWPTITSQTVGDHCWGVYHIYWRIFGLPSAEVALYIHLHDAPELAVGDNPFPSKARYPKLKEAVTEAEVDASITMGIPTPQEIGDFSEEELTKIKICDLLEMMQFGMQEREMGNLLGTPVIERTRAAALSRAQTLNVTDSLEVHNWIMREGLRHSLVLVKSGSTQ